MTNEIGINWKGSISEKAPLFQIPNESELDELFSESMALYGEACYVQEAYEEYITEAKDGGPGALTNTVRLIKNLIGRFVRAITRFMANKTCQKAIYYLGGYIIGKVSIRDYIKENWPLKESDPGYTLLVAVFRMKLILKHVDVYEFLMKTNCNDPDKIRKKIEDIGLGVVDTGHFKITEVTLSGALKVYDQMFPRDKGINGSNKTLTDIIRTLEKFNTFWSPYDEEGKDSPVVKMITTDIKAFAQFQKEIIESYRFFSSEAFLDDRIKKNMIKIDNLIEKRDNARKELQELEKINKEKQEKINELVDKLIKENKDIPINYNKK